MLLFFGIGPFSMLRNTEDKKVVGEKMMVKYMKSVI